MRFLGLKFEILAKECTLDGKIQQILLSTNEHSNMDVTNIITDLNSAEGFLHEKISRLTDCFKIPSSGA